jgi:hypothetical protein
MFAALLALSLQAATPAPVAPPPPLVPATVPTIMPADLLDAFAGAEQALAKMSACVAANGVSPQRLAVLDSRMMRLQQTANGVWGPAPLRALDSNASSEGDCAAAGGAIALSTAAELKLTQLTAKLGRLLEPMRSGVWFGTMPLCQRGSLRAELLVEVYSGNPYLLLTLDPALTGELAALTGRHVGHLLAFRAGGRVVAEPQVNEPITGGQLQLGGPPLPELQRAAAVIKICGKPAA